MSQLLTFSRELFDDYSYAPVIIEKNVWIGENVVILKGVTIGEGSIIAASCVVTKNVPPFSLYGGVPGKIIKSLN